MLAGFAAMGMGVSLAFHAALLTVLAFWVIRGLEHDQALLLSASEVVGIDPELEEVTELSLEPEGGAPEKSSPLDVQPIPIIEPQDVKTTLPASVHEHVARLVESAVAGEGTGDGEGDRAGDGRGTEGGLPRGAAPGRNAVTKGSFTAWTDPSSPAEGQPYKIYVHVKLPPEKKRKYRVNDLTGRVDGTDDWTCPLGFYTGGRLGQFYFAAGYYGNFVPRSNLFVIEIPGAQELVEDTIRVRSKVLDEEQTLKLVFGRSRRR